MRSPEPASQEVVAIQEAIPVEKLVVIQEAIPVEKLEAKLVVIQEAIPVEKQVGVIQPEWKREAVKPEELRGVEPLRLHSIPRLRVPPHPELSRSPEFQMGERDLRRLAGL